MKLNMSEMTENKQFKFKLQVALYLIFHSWELAKELVDGFEYGRM